MLWSWELQGLVSKRLLPVFGHQPQSGGLRRSLLLLCSSAESGQNQTLCVCSWFLKKHLDGCSWAINTLRTTTRIPEVNVASDQLRSRRRRQHVDEGTDAVKGFNETKDKEGKSRVRVQYCSVSTAEEQVGFLGLFLWNVPTVFSLISMEPQPVAVETSVHLLLLKCCFPCQTVLNTMCGYGQQRVEERSARQKIFTAGCLEKIVWWAKNNLLLVAGLSGGLLLLEVTSVHIQLLSWRETGLFVPYLCWCTPPTVTDMTSLVLVAINRLMTGSKKQHFLTCLCFPLQLVMICLAAAQISWINKVLRQAGSKPPRNDSLSYPAFGNSDE